MNIKYLAGLLLGFSLLYWPQPATADVHQQLHAFLSDVGALSARFEQLQLDEDGAELGSSSGRLWIQRPDRFRWAYSQPYEQLILSDGESIWLYDPDLEQVTRRSAGAALDGTPAALLSQSADALAGFDQHELGGQDGLQGLRLTPTSQESDFRAIELWFSGRIPVRLVFHDQLGGITRILLRDIQVNPRISPAQFQFTVPPGVEVVDTR